MKRECLLIIGLAVASVVSLKCYFCRSDYDSRTDDEEKTKTIPYCGKEPYQGGEMQLVDCDIYYDHFGMVHPTFKEALSSTTEDTRKKKKRNVSRTATEPKISHHQAEEGEEGENSTVDEYTNEGIRSEGDESRLLVPVDSEVKSSPHKTVYPYKLAGQPWGTQSVHPRVQAYLCLTVHTINSTFPSRVCGLRYFLDCQLLVELTSEPLEPSSFITRCHQCDRDLCNTAARLEMNFLGFFLILNAISMYCVYFSYV